MCKDELQNERFAKPSQSLSGALREPPKPPKNPKPGGVGTQRNPAQPSAASQTFQHHRSCEVVVLMLGVLQNERFARRIRKAFAKPFGSASGAPKNFKKNPNLGGTGLSRTQPQPAPPSATQRNPAVPSGPQAYTKWMQLSIWEFM